jgi:hypothetical protein
MKLPYCVSNFLRCPVNSSLLDSIILLEFYSKTPSKVMKTGQHICPERWYLQVHMTIHTRRRITVSSSPLELQMPPHESTLIVITPKYFMSSMFCHFHFPQMLSQQKILRSIQTYKSLHVLQEPATTHNARTV